MSRLPIRPRLGIGPPSVPTGGDGRSWESRREVRDRQAGEAAERRERAGAGGMRSGSGRSKKGSAGRSSGIGRARPTPDTRSRTPVSTPKGPGRSVFPTRLPDRRPAPSAGRSPTQNARRSLFGSVGDRLRRAAGLLGF